MPWYRMRIDQGGLLTGIFHLNFGSRGNKKAPRPCSVCGYISERECDWKLEDVGISGGGKVIPATCDRALCKYCTTSPAPEKDLCPRHELARRAWLAGRSNSTDGEGPCPAITYSA